MPRLAINKIFQILIIAAPFAAHAQLPKAPSDALHPGSKVYEFATTTTEVSCGNRKAQLVLPKSKMPRVAMSPVPVVIFGRGQALNFSNYQGTFEHLAKKGIAVIHPIYDTGFFDQNWNRMASDYMSITDCVLNQFPQQLDRSKLIFSGHSKGAYVASIAAGLAFTGSQKVEPKMVILFAPAGNDQKALAQIEPGVSLTVVFSDADTIVDQKFSRQIYDLTPSRKKQYITIKSYTQAQGGAELKADHMWPLTQGSFAGGGNESSLHYFGSWKWLTAAGFDLRDGGRFTNDYLFGTESLSKGVEGFSDSALRNF